MTKNYVNIQGNLGRDADHKVFPSGARKTTLNVATSYEKDGVKYTEWHKVVGWNDIADELANLKKGDTIEVHGSLRTRSWEADGQKKYITEVVVFRTGSDDNRKSGAKNVPDEDLPF